MDSSNINDNCSKKYIVFGDPIPLARARMGKYGVWDSQKAIKHSCAMQIEDQHKGLSFFKGPLQMDLIFYMPIPKSKSKTKQENLRNSWHYIKPDSSNIIKFYEDIAIGILYQDDATICKINSEKRYDDGQGPRTEIIIQQL